MRKVTFFFFYLYRFVVFTVIGVCGVGTVDSSDTHVFVASDVCFGESPFQQNADTQQDKCYADQDKNNNKNVTVMISFLDFSKGREIKRKRRSRFLKKD